jgi:hypothetical protein
MLCATPGALHSGSKRSRDRAREKEEREAILQASNFLSASRQIENHLCTARESLLGSGAWNKEFYAELQSRPFYQSINVTMCASVKGAHLLKSLLSRGALYMAAHAAGVGTIAASWALSTPNLVLLYCASLLTTRCFVRLILQNTGAGRFSAGDGEYPAGYESEDGGRDSDVEEKIRCAACNRATQQPDIQVCCLCTVAWCCVRLTTLRSAWKKADIRCVNAVLTRLCSCCRCSCSAAATTRARCGIRSAGTSTCPR